MQFAEPTYLFAIPLAILLITLIYWAGEKRMRDKLSRFVSNKLIGNLVQSYSLRRQVVKGILVCLAFICFIIALARPQWGSTWEKVEVKGIDILIALDTSKSMLAEDLQPNRMQRAKLAIQDLLPQVEGNRIGLITFAGQSFLQCPLTLDMNAVEQTLITVDTNSVPQGGTDLATAITDARLTFNKKRNHKFLVIITDGEDLEASGIEAARQAAAEGVIIYTVGVGSTEGALIPITDKLGNREFMKDQRGEGVITRLDEMTLKTIAQVTKGMYTRLGSTGLDEVYEKAMETIPEEEKEEDQLRKTPIERFQWPLGMGVFLLMLEGMISVRKHTRKASKMLLWGLICLGALQFGSNRSYAEEAADMPQEEVVKEIDPTPGNAYRSYKEKSFETSAKLYRELSREDSEDARLVFNHGDALYRNGNYSEAVDSYVEALKSKDMDLQADAFYNLGNTYHKMGEARFEMNPKDTRLLWEQGIKYFDNALLVNEEQGDAKYNAQALRDLLESILRTLTVEPIPAEGGSVSGSGRFAVGEKTLAKAKVNDGWRFDGWRCETPENIASPDKETTSITVAGDMSVGAIFIKTYYLYVGVNDEAAGSAEKTGVYDADSDTPIKATSNEHYVFDYWEGDGIADIHNPETTVKMDEDKTVTAYFVPAYELKVKLDHELAGKAMKDGWYKRGTEVPIQYLAHDGWELDHWEGADQFADAQSAETSLILNRNTEVTAVTKRVKKVILYATPEEGGTVLGSSNAEDGTVIDIEAAPEDGYTFKGWQGEGIEDPTSPKTHLTVNGEEDVFAVFESDDQDNNDDQNQNNNNENQDNQDNQDDKNNNQSDQQENQDQSNNDKSDQEQSPQDQDQSQKDDKDQQDQNEDKGEDQQDSQDKQDQQDDQQESQDKGDQEEQPKNQEKQDSEQNSADQDKQNQEQQGQKDQEGEQSPEKDDSSEEQQAEQDDQGEEEKAQQQEQGQDQGQSAEEEESSQSEAQGANQQPVPVSPGTMSPTEAGQLLDSIKDEEEKLPISILMGNGKKNDSKGRDW